MKIYHDEIMRLAKSGEGEGTLAHAADALSHRLTNPLCGDECTLHLQVAEGAIAAAAHQTRGCVLCHAAAAQLILLSKDTPPLEEMTALAHALAHALKNGTPLPEKLEHFTPVAERKSRHNCILLPYQALLEIADKVPKG